MTEITNNPIPFNPATMTAQQLFDCAQSLREIFNGLERLRDLNDSYDDLENFLYHIEQARDSMATVWKRYR